MKKNRIELREERKQQIMEVALELFSKNGFHGVSVSTIAKACEMSKGLMYSYFASKEALLEFILTDYAQKIHLNLDLNKDGVLTREEFEYFVRSIYRLVKEHPKYYKLIFSFSFQESIAQKLAALAADMMPLNFELLRDYFYSIGREDPDSEVLMFSSILKGLLLQVVMIFEFVDLIPVYQEKYDELVERIIKDYT